MTFAAARASVQMVSLLPPEFAACKAGESAHAGVMAPHLQRGSSSLIGDHQTIAVSPCQWS